MLALLACADPAPPAAAAFSSNLPVVALDSAGHDVDAESGGEGDRQDWPMRDVTVAVWEPGEAGRASLADAPTWEGRGAARVRGNSSQVLPKKSYALELRDDDGDDLAVPLLGMPAEADWVLMAPYGDKSLLRDHLAYRWAAAMGRYAPRSVHVEVFFDQDGGGLDDDDYRGVYLLVEKVERGDDRVDIARLDDDDLDDPEVSGGWLFKADVPDEDEAPFRTTLGTPPLWPAIGFLHVDPEEPAPEQAAWLLAWLDTFEADLAAGAGQDRIDVASFVDYALLTEALKNADGYYASLYLHKDREGPLAIGPVWDWNVSFGGTTDWDCYEPEGWLAERVETFWYPELFADPAFVARWQAGRDELRGGDWATGALLADVEARAATLEEAQARNFARWPILGEPIEELPHTSWPGWEERVTWRDEVDWLEGWLSTRLDWLDEAGVPAPRGE